MVLAGRLYPFCAEHGGIGIAVKILRDLARSFQFDAIKEILRKSRHA